MTCSHTAQSMFCTHWWHTPFLPSQSHEQVLKNELVDLANISTVIVQLTKKSKLFPSKEKSSSMNNLNLNLTENLKCKIIIIHFYLQPETTWISILCWELVWLLLCCYIATLKKSHNYQYKLFKFICTIHCEKDTDDDLTTELNNSRKWIFKER